MLKIGDFVINLGAIAYVDLNSKKERITGKAVDGVVIYFNASGADGCNRSLFLKGEEAEQARKYFNAVARECSPFE